MNRYIVVNNKATDTTVWETIGANYTPSKGEVCIIVPPSKDINISEESTAKISGGVYATDDNGNITLHSNGADTNVYPVAIKIGDGSNVFRDLPTLTSGNVQGDWSTVDPSNPSYIKHKPILNDDLFEQSEEKILLISSSYLNSLFDFEYAGEISAEQKSKYLTRAEKIGLEYIITANSYDLNDNLNRYTRVFTNSENSRNEIIEKINSFNTTYKLIGLAGEITTAEIAYLNSLIKNGQASQETNIESVEARDSLRTKINSVLSAEDITSIVSITPKQETAIIKQFHSEKYIKISNTYLHPNDMLIYNDNNWGYYELRMYGLQDYKFNFTEEERNYLTSIIEGRLSKSEYVYISDNLIGFLSTQIENIIDVYAQKDFLIRKLNYILPSLSKDDLIEAITKIYREAEKEVPVNLADLSADDLLIKLISAINNFITLDDKNKAVLLTKIKESTSSSLEINKQPRFWFYKSNILRIKEKEALGKIMQDALFVYNNKFNSKEQEILLLLLNNKTIPTDVINQLNGGLADILTNKIRFNSDITVANGKKYLISKLQLDEEPSITLTDDEIQQLAKQIILSKNSLDQTLSQSEMNEISNALLEELSTTIATVDKNTLIENLIVQGYQGDNVYYEINNEMIFDIEEHSIYMRLESLIGYLKQTKSLEIIFHYKTRSLSSKYTSDFMADWNETNEEQTGYIHNKPVWKENSVIYTQDWFREWLLQFIDGAINRWFQKNLLPRLENIEGRLDDLENKYNALEQRVSNIEEVLDISQNTYLNRIKNLIVAQPTKPILSKDFLPKIWICTDASSGYGLLYWRNGGEDSNGNYVSNSNVFWTPISSIWSPDKI